MLHALDGLVGNGAAAAEHKTSIDRASSCGSLTGLDMLSLHDDGVFSSPLDTTLSGLPSSPLRLPQPPKSPVALQHETVQRCLFQGEAQKAFRALPRLIMPAAPSAGCYGVSPMQLTTPAPTAEPALQQGDAADEAQHKQGVQEWLACMEQGLGSGRMRTSSDAVCAEPCMDRPAAGDLPPPAFVLMGVLQAQDSP